MDTLTKVGLITIGVMSLAFRTVYFKRRYLGPSKQQKS